MSVFSRPREPHGWRSRPPSLSQLSNRAFWAVVAILVVARVGVAAVALSENASRGPHTVLPGDIRRFHAIASAPGTPYRDFEVEYPPVTLAAIELFDGPTVRSMTVHVVWSQVVLDVAVAGILLVGWGRRAALGYLLIGLLFLAYPFLYFRLDLLSVALALGALALARRRHPAAGGALLAIACFAKVWPVVLVPALCVRRPRSVLPSFVTTALVGLLSWIAVGGIDGPVQVLTFRGARGWQIESTVGSVVHVFSAREAFFSQGAARIGDVPTWAILALLVLGLALVAGIWITTAGVAGDRPSALEGLAPLAAVAAVLVTATVLSPQYTIWLVPFTAIAASYGAPRVTSLTVGVCAASVLSLNLAKELIAGSPWPMALVLVRNGLLIALLAVAGGQLLDLARGRALVEEIPEPEERVA